MNLEVNATDLRSCQGPQARLSQGSGMTLLLFWGSVVDWFLVGHPILSREHLDAEARLEASAEKP